MDKLSFLNNLKGAFYGLLVIGFIAPILELITKGYIPTSSIIACVGAIILSLFALKTLNRKISYISNENAE